MEAATIAKGSIISIKEEPKRLSIKFIMLRFHPTEMDNNLCHTGHSLHSPSSSSSPHTAGSRPCRTPHMCPHWRSGRSRPHRQPRHNPRISYLFYSNVHLPGCHSSPSQLKNTLDSCGFPQLWSSPHVCRPKLQCTHAITASVARKFASSTSVMLLIMSPFFMRFPPVTH